MSGSRLESSDREKIFMAKRSPRVRRCRFDVADIHAVLEAVVFADPHRRDHYVATGHAPRYVVAGHPCCLVAAVLWELGFSLGVLRALDRESKDPTGRAGGTIELSGSQHPILKRFTPAARALLESLQRHQDRKQPWAKVVADACGRDPHWLDQRHHREGRPWMPLPVAPDATTESARS
ncbi:hypothetical protein [Nocardia niwae]|uniref:hypothetical protein n=1 Tax=Nocardia niwae TaxID=626084 RepID=UPI0033FC8560